MKILLDTAKETLTVDGVTVSLEFIRTLVNPDESMFYRFERNYDEVRCTAFRLEQFGAPKYQN